MDLAKGTGAGRESALLASHRSELGIAVQTLLDWRATADIGAPCSLHSGLSHDAQEGEVGLEMM